MGEVYGVPARELGKYRALAVEPKTPPQTLADTADEVLLGYVAKVAEEERDGTGAR